MRLTISTYVPLQGRVALVTGCGNAHGIGFATARRLAEHGATVAITSTTARIHDRAAELSADGYGISAFICDLMDMSQAALLARSVHDRFGTIDILVNNAGLAQVGHPSSSGLFVDLDTASWQTTIDRNLTTTFNMTRVVAPLMVERGYGRIVNVSSVTGPRVAYAGGSAYATAKAGMDGFTRALALELGPSGVTVNSVAPGWIATDPSPDPIVLEGGRHTPIGRAGEPEEVGALIAFLASEPASYVTGQSLVIDGGNILQEYKS
jgi:3-oxoacyl-[acyl-carrier protein] reductase